MASASTSPPRAAAYSSASDAPEPAAVLNSVIDQRATRLRQPRSLPPWIDSYERGHGPVSSEQLRLLNPPERTVRPQHNASPDEPQRRVSRDGFVDWDDPHLGPAQNARARLPHFLRYGRASMRGRRWDHLRSAEPVIVAGYNAAASQPSTSWRDFIHSSSYGHMTNERSEVVDYEVLNKLQPNFNRPVDVPLNILKSRASRRRRTIVLYKRIWNVVIRHSLSPLLFRLAVIITSLLALGISARIYRLENAFHRDSAERTQSAVAVVVDTVAVPYVAYMIWDEFTGKPVGLRSGISKISLILLDLFFIIFKSASTALAFETLVYHDVQLEEIRRLSDALAACMFIGLICWTMNFTVNIFRTVERLGGGGEDDGAHV